MLGENCAFFHLLAFLHRKPKATSPRRGHGVAVPVIEHILYASASNALISYLFNLPYSIVGHALFTLPEKHISG